MSHPQPDLVSAICPVGNHEFTYERSATKPKTYCSKQHAQAANNAKKRQRHERGEPRHCPRCDTTKPAGAFSPTATYCHPCASAYISARTDDRRRATLKKYGLTPDSFEALFASQDRRCAICGTGEPEGGGTWQVDHDHACCPITPTCGNCNRGVLCGGCNWAIGCFRDDPDVIQAASAYILRWRTEHGLEPHQSAKSNLDI